MEGTEFGLSMYIKELLPNGAKLLYPPYLKVPSEERPQWGEEQDQRGLVLEDFVKSFRRKPKDS